MQTSLENIIDKYEVIFCLVHEYRQGSIMDIGYADTSIGSRVRHCNTIQNKFKGVLTGHCFIRTMTGKWARTKPDYSRMCGEK